MTSLTVSAAMATMRSIADYTSADFDTLGITPTDFNLVYGSAPWTRDHRRRVTATIDALLFGTLDVMGLPRIAVPSEYVAAILATFVSPSNRMTACIWMAEQRATGARAMDLASGAIEGNQVDPTSASQLFALIVLLSDSEESTTVRKTFSARMDSRTQMATQGFKQ